MPDRTIKLAVVGLGMASKPHLAALKQLEPEVEVAGVYTRSAERRAEVSETTGWPAFDSLDAITRSDADAAIIITPPNARAELVSALADAGKAILMEKPVERDLARAEQIVEICETASVPLGMVLQHRFRAGAEALANVMASGKVGRLQMVRVALPWWRDQSYYDQPGRGTYDVDGGGVLLTQAIHVLDLMLSLTGPVAEVSAMTGTTDLHQMEAEDFATAGLRFENGAMGSIVATTSSFPGDAETLVLDCENASLQLTGGELVVHWRDGQRETVGEVTGTGGGSDPMDFPCDWHRDLIVDFSSALRTGRQPRITGREALRVHRLIDEIERSANSGTTTKVRGEA